MTTNFLDQTISLRTLLFIGFIGFIVFIIFTSIALKGFFGGVKEGFDAGLFGISSAIDYKMGHGVKSSWENINSNDLTTKEPSTIYGNLEQNVGGPIPLPENELVFFDQNKFTPECCPSSYSNSSGCLCASPEQMNYLNERGGNRTLPGNY